MTRASKLVLPLLVACLSPLLLLQGLANAGYPLGPAQAWNGFNTARVAMTRLEVTQDEAEITLRVDQDGAEVARRAFAREPLASDALFVLAVDARSDGRNEEGSALIESAYKLDKRNRNIGVLQLQDAAAQQDFPETFAVLDRLSRTYPTLTRQFVQPLVGAVTDPTAIEVLEDAIAADPVWAPAFWDGVLPDPDIASGMLELRERTAVGTDAESDAALLAALVEAGLYDGAFRFWSESSGADVAATGFLAGNDEPPFGWELTTTGVRSMSWRGNGEYEVFVERDTQGQLARQLVKLAPGRYRVTAAIEPENEAPNFAARLQCVTSDTPGEEQALSEPVVFNIGTDDCPSHWLIIEGSAWERRLSMRAQISDIDLQRIE